jgi:hypothetical protein
MTGACDFIACLARDGKSYDEIKKTVDSVFGDKTLQKMAIYAIIKKVKAGKTTSDQCHMKGKKTVRKVTLITSVAAAVEQDHRLSIKSFPVSHGVGVGTIHRILHEDSGLNKSLTPGCPNCCLRSRKFSVWRTAASSLPPVTATCLRF